MRERNGRRHGTLAALTLAITVLAAWPAAGLSQPMSNDTSPTAQRAIRLAQLPRYSAAGMHQCRSGSGGKRSCLVSGLFGSCNEASISLRTRDCCPTGTGGGTSAGFSLTYCIPDLSGRR